MPNNNNENNNNNSGGGGIGPAGLGMLQGAFNMLGAGQQHRRQKELMDIQFGNQQQLNRQGHQLQMDMWNKTNYGAQIEHMKKAGLNPALMYGMSGGGGTTAGSQGGGSASSGSAVQMHPMDMANLSLVQAQKDKLKAEENNINKDTEVKDELVGKTEAEKNKIVADKLLSEQQLSESKQRELNLKTENEIKEYDRDYMKKNNISSLDTGIIRTLKASGMSIGEALKYYDENGGFIKSMMNENKNYETGQDNKGSWFIDKRNGKKIYY